MSNIDRQAIKDAFLEVAEELENALTVFDKFNSLHEGFAVIQEEVDELWDEVKRRHAPVGVLRNEAKQVAAMAIRFMIELVPID